MWALLVPFAIYFLSAMTTNLNIGFRHVLPLYPFVYVWIGLGAAWVVVRWKRLAQVLGFGLVIALSVEAGAFMAQLHRVFQRIRRRIAGRVQAAGRFQPRLGPGPSAAG